MNTVANENNSMVIVPIETLNQMTAQMQKMSKQLERMQSKDNDKFITIKEVERLTGLCRNTILKYVERKKKEELAKRDKGKGKYEQWFAFGRTQSLEKVANKLFFPKFSDKTPNYLISNDDNLLFYNGQAIIGHSEEEMLFAKKILESRLFWYYIKTTSKPYSSSYYSLNGTYIRNFGIPEFTENDIHFIINESNQKTIDDLLEDYYGIQLDELTITE